MSTNTDEKIDETDDKKPVPSASRGWRKACAWLLGAAALAFVGYRGTLGTPAADAATAPLSATAEPIRMGTSEAPTTGTPTGSAVNGAASFGGAPGKDVAPTSAASAASEAPVTASSASAKAPPAEAPSPAITADGKVILNLATEVELRKLPGIGKARAQAILDLRAKLGKFKRVEDLLRVKGIGVRRLAAIKPKVVLDAP